MLPAVILDAFGLDLASGLHSLGFWLDLIRFRLDFGWFRLDFGAIWIGFRTFACFSYDFWLF